jgi:hypothetical protein
LGGTPTPIGSQRAAVSAPAISTVYARVMIAPVSRLTWNDSSPLPLTRRRSLCTYPATLGPAGHREPGEHDGRRSASPSKLASLKPTAPPSCARGALAPDPVLPRSGGQPRHHRRRGPVRARRGGVLGGRRVGCWPRAGPSPTRLGDQHELIPYLRVILLRSSANNNRKTAFNRWSPHWRRHFFGLVSRQLQHRYNLIDLPWLHDRFPGERW